MEMTKSAIRQEPLPTWPVKLLSQLPLWLFTLSVSAEGFPTPRLPLWLAMGSSFLGIAVILFLAWKSWLDASWFATMLPFVLMMLLDEIATSYKTPFLLCCTAITSASIFLYQSLHGRRWRWMVLIAGVIISLLAASHAAGAYWPLVEQGFLECYPSCSPVSGQETPWWMLFFTL